MLVFCWREVRNVFFLQPRGQLGYYNFAVRSGWLPYTCCEVRIHRNELPVVPTFNIVGVVADLGLVAVFLVFTIRTDSRVARNLSLCLCHQWSL